MDAEKKNYELKDEAAYILEGVETFDLRELKDLNVKEVHIPKSMTAIENNCWLSVKNGFFVDSENPSYKSVDGVLYDKSGKELLRCPIGRAGEFAVPDGVETIEHLSFAGCNDLSSVILPNSVKRIGSGAFTNCSNLTNISIPEEIESVSGYFKPFAGCDSLPVENGIRYAGCILAEVIDKERDSYEIRNGTKIIGSHAFKGCSRLASITIPDGVTSIGNYAFDGCSSLTSIALPESLTRIGEHAFCGCSSLTSITIPEVVTSIGDYAFSGCSSLTSIALPESLTSIGEHAFNKCEINSLLIASHYYPDLRAHTIDFSKSLTSLPEDAHISAEIIRINDCQANVRSKLLAICDRNPKDIVFAAPELCKASSSIPGYIKVTRAYYNSLRDEDRIVDINTRYIAYVEPCEIKERYTPVVGSRIHLALPNSDQRFESVLVYEPADLVVQKIKDSLENLSEQVGGIAGLLNQIELLYNKKKNSEE